MITRYPINLKNTAASPIRLKTEIHFKENWLIQVILIEDLMSVDYTLK